VRASTAFRWDRAPTLVHEYEAAFMEIKLGDAFVPQTAGHGGGASIGLIGVNTLNVGLESASALSQELLSISSSIRSSSIVV
jgi:hypothetical protein